MVNQLSDWTRYRALSFDNKKTETCHPRRQPFIDGLNARAICLLPPCILFLSRIRREKTIQITSRGNFQVYVFRIKSRRNDNVQISRETTIEQTEQKSQRNLRIDRRDNFSKFARRTKNGTSEHIIFSITHRHVRVCVCVGDDRVLLAPSSPPSSKSVLFEISRPSRLHCIN